MATVPAVGGADDEVAMMVDTFKVEVRLRGEDDHWMVCGHVKASDMVEHLSVLVDDTDQVDDPNDPNWEGVIIDKIYWDEMVYKLDLATNALKGIAGIDFEPAMNHAKLAATAIDYSEEEARSIMAGDAP